VAICGPRGRDTGDGCRGRSSIVAMGRLCDLRHVVGWFCDMVQKQAMISRFADGANEASGDAGHAVAAVVLRLKIGRRGVTIVPEKTTRHTGLYECCGQTKSASRLRLGGSAFGWRCRRTQI